MTGDWKVANAVFGRKHPCFLFRFVQSCFCLRDTLLGSVFIHRDRESRELH